MVERLEEAGWVRRAPEAGDGRGVVVGLTAAGAALQKEGGRRHVQAIAHYVGGALGPQQLAALTEGAGAL
ncbi:MarR family winged helix-turn-helix transcriptional regulator, partial [Cellulomonas sp. GbtcB1]|uniref:MarR family winged helix-turn-helix transcriptional regulator n=1 Tax=Cellulomonas sp. GbtcB1 TaxID=2824746 RepID=UPI0034D4E19F